MGAVSSQADLVSWRVVPPTVSALGLSTPGFLPKSLTSAHISLSASQAFVMLKFPNSLTTQAKSFGLIGISDFVFSFTSLLIRRHASETLQVGLQANHSKASHAHFGGFPNAYKSHIYTTYSLLGVQ